MRLLVVNANTSEAVTRIVSSAALRFASPGTELAFATGSFGARVIASRTENAIAQHATVDLLAKHAAESDGVLIAVSYDSGLRAAREMLGTPVLAITEASLLAALTLGTRIGLVVWGRGSVGIYLEIIDSYGLGSRICGSRKLDIEVPDTSAKQAAMDEAIVAAAGALVEQQDAEVVVLIGAVLAGRSAELQSRVAVPLLDGVRCAIPLLEAMVRIGAKAPSAGSYSLPRLNENKGLSRDLESLLHRHR